MSAGCYLTWFLVEKQTKIIKDHYYGTYYEAQHIFYSKLDNNHEIQSQSKYYGF